jgi:hypothetical protein
LASRAGTVRVYILHIGLDWQYYWNMRMEMHAHSPSFDVGEERRRCGIIRDIAVVSEEAFRDFGAQVTFAHLDRIGSREVESFVIHFLAEPAWSLISPL